MNCSKGQSLEVKAIKSLPEFSSEPWGSSSSAWTTPSKKSFNPIMASPSSLHVFSRDFWLKAGMVTDGFIYCLWRSLTQGSVFYSTRRFVDGLWAPFAIRYLPIGRNRWSLYSDHFPPEKTVEQRTKNCQSDQTCLYRTMSASWNRTLAPSQMKRSITLTAIL